MALASEPESCIVAVAPAAILPVPASCNIMSKVDVVSP